MLRTGLLAAACLCAALIISACAKPDTQAPAEKQPEVAGRDGSPVMLVGFMSFRKGWGITTEADGWLHLTGNIKELSVEKHQDKMARVKGCWRAPTLRHEDLDPADQAASPRLYWHVEVESIEFMPDK